MRKNSEICSNQLRNSSKKMGLLNLLQGKEQVYFFKTDTGFAVYAGTR